MRAIGINLAVRIGRGPHFGAAGIKRGRADITAVAIISIAGTVIIGLSDRAFVSRH